MPLPPELIAAYVNADYVVFGKMPGDPELVLRVGEPSGRLDAMLEAAGAATAAFLTAANPRSEPRGEAENASAFQTLESLLGQSQFRLHRGEGRDPEGRWAPEPSILVLGIYRANAMALGALFAQNAIVFVEKGQAPELVLLG